MKRSIALILSLTLVLALVGCGKAEQNSTPDTPNTLVPAVMYNGEIYRTTGKQVPAEVDPSAVIGEITSVVPLSQWPAEEWQANCGEVGDPVALTEDGPLVLLNNEWMIFELQPNE